MTRPSRLHHELFGDPPKPAYTIVDEPQPGEQPDGRHLVDAVRRVDRRGRF